jgi:RTX calcium-binding nonapeptide repeat (4 copies)
MRTWGAATILATLAVAAPAHAGVLHYEPDRFGQPWSGSSVEYTADPGETNRVTLTQATTEAVLDLDSVVITDAGAPVRPDPASPETTQQCSFFDHGAICHAKRFNLASVALGDGDDSAGVVADPLSITSLDGGAGNDVLVGSAGVENFTGGPGADDISGGGARGDAMSYGDDGDPLTGVTVTLDDLPNDGHPGERDNVRSNIERVTGTPGPDRLTGSALANSLNGYEGDDILSGGPGDDALHGLSGDDTLIGGLGADTLLGSTGSDVLRARDGARDMLDCGEDSDTAFTDAVEEWVLECETVQAG